jgi:hypothetical protein
VLAEPGRLFVKDLRPESHTPGVRDSPDSDELGDNCYRLDLIQ